MSFKNELQEFLQKRSCKPPSYRLLDCSGPSHKPLFEYSVFAVYKGVQYEENGSGSNKKVAQQEAARKLLERLVNGGTSDEQVSFICRYVSKMSG